MVVRTHVNRCVFPIKGFIYTQVGSRSEGVLTSERDLDVRTVMDVQRTIRCKHIWRCELVAATEEGSHYRESGFTIIKLNELLHGQMYMSMETVHLLS